MDQPFIDASWDVAVVPSNFPGSERRPLARLRLPDMPYSYRRASMGSTAAALLAG